MRNEKVRTLLKRCADEFPTRVIAKKSKLDEQADANIFAKQSTVANEFDDNNLASTTDGETRTNGNGGLDLDGLLNGTDKVCFSDY